MIPKTVADENDGLVDLISLLEICKYVWAMKRYPSLPAIRQNRIQQHYGNSCHIGIRIRIDSCIVPEGQDPRLDIGPELSW